MKQLRSPAEALGRGVEDAGGYEPLTRGFQLGHSRVNAVKNDFLCVSAGEGNTIKITCRRH